MAQKPADVTVALELRCTALNKKMAQLTRGGVRSRQTEGLLKYVLTWVKENGGCGHTLCILRNRPNPDIQGPCHANEPHCDRAALDRKAT